LLSKLHDLDFATLSPYPWICSVLIQWNYGNQNILWLIVQLFSYWTKRFMILGVMQIFIRHNMLENIDKWVNSCEFLGCYNFGILIVNIQYYTNSSCFDFKVSSFYSTLFGFMSCYSLVSVIVERKIGMWRGCNCKITTSSINKNIYL